MLARVRPSKPNGLRRGGLIAHASGTGKPLTMMMAVAALWDSVDRLNSRIVLVSDYSDLAKHLLSRGGMDCRRASTGTQLWALLRRGASLIVCAISKFDAALRPPFLPFDDPNTFILIDEDRTRVADRVKLMRHFLPRACFIGFSSDAPPVGPGLPIPLFGEVIG